MSSFVVESRKLDAYSEQLVIGVVGSKLLVAGDLLPSYQPESGSSKGGLCLLSRTFCGADEFEVLATIPFVSYSACSTHSGHCSDFNTSKAIYTLDPTNQFIWAFTYGIFDNEQSPHQWMFRIDAISGEYLHFKINELKTSENGRWEVCTVCRASELQWVGEDSCVHLIIHDSNVIGWECNENSWNDLYHHDDTFYSIAISVDLESNTFDMTCSEYKFPSRSEPSACPIQPLDNNFSEWCWIVNDILVVYNINTYQSNAFLPKTKASKRLVMEPRVAQSNGISHRTFHIYDIHLFKSDKTFGLTKVKQSNPVPRSILQMHKSGYIQQSRTHLQNGMLYKFYANYCLTMFLRIPTLQEAAFVGLQKMWMTEQDKVLFDGISQEQLIQELDINAIWF